MKYTEKDIKEGTKLRCTKTNPRWGKLGKVYTVSLNDDGILHIKDDEGYPAFTSYMLDCLNEEYSAVVFEIVKEEKEMTNYVEITKLMEFTPDEEVIEIGKKYEVVEECGGGVYIYAHEKAPKYFLYNDQFKEVKEEKQMQYTEKDLKDGTKLICTQDGGCNWWTKGGIYTVVNKCILDNFGDSVESWYILDCLNGQVNRRQRFEIFEYPTATITVDVEQRLNDKIEALASERENILAKMDRMEKQQLKLRDKVLKLNEAKKALEILKELK